MKKSQTIFQISIVGMFVLFLFSFCKLIGSAVYETRQATLGLLPCFVHEKIIEENDSGWKYYLRLETEKKKFTIESDVLLHTKVNKGESYYLSISRNQINQRSVYWLDMIYYGTIMILIFLVAVVLSSFDNLHI